MGFLPKRITLQNLDTVDVYIEDTNNQYFNVQDVPTTITQGRYAFKLFGSDFLNPGVELKMELLDAEGNTIFLTPVDFIGEEVPPYVPYRYVTIEVYSPPINVAGLATLTLLGELNPNVVDVPREFSNAYNVRYQQTINVDLSTAVNIQPIRFFKNPTTEFKEIVQAKTILSPVSQSIVTSNISGIPRSDLKGKIVEIESGSLEKEAAPKEISDTFKDLRRFKDEYKYKTGLRGKTPAIIKRRGISTVFASKEEPKFKLKSNSPIFKADMQGGFIEIPARTVTLKKTDPVTNRLKTEVVNVPKFKTKILEVVDENTIIPEEIPLVPRPTGSVPRGTDIKEVIIEDFSNTPMTASFNATNITPSKSAVNFDSLLELTINDMRTFSGDIYRIRVHGKSEAGGSDFTVLTDSIVESPELLVDKDSSSGVLRTGYFINQSHINTYWNNFSIDNGTKGSGVQTSHTGSNFIDSMYVSGSTLGLKQSVVVETKPLRAFTLRKNVAYTLSAKVKGQLTSKITDETNTIRRVGKLYFHLSGSNLNTSQIEKSHTHFGFELTDDATGEPVVLQLDEDIAGIQNFETIEHTFKPKFNLDRTVNTDTILQIRAESGEWFISDISLRPAMDTGFSPDTFDLKVPIPRSIRPDRFDFLIEYFDVNNNVAETVTILQDVPISGSALVIDGDGNLLTGSLFMGNAIDSGIEAAGVNSAFVRSVGYEGFESASLGGKGGFMIFSGSVLPNSPDNYEGAGIEIHDGTTGDDESYLKFRTNPSLFDVKTSTFFFGKKQSPANFISGSNGNLQISSSNFELSPAGDVTMSGEINAVGGTIGGFDLASTTISTTGVTLGNSDEDLFISSSAFKVDHFGNITASNIDLGGSISATSGDVGGFDIKAGSLTAGTGDSSITMSSADTIISIGSGSTFNKGDLEGGLRVGVDSDGQFKFAVGSAGSYIHADNTGVSIKSDSFDVTASIAEIDVDVFKLSANELFISSSQGGFIRMGSTLPTGITGTNKGIYMQGSNNHFLVGNAAGGHFKFDGTNTSISSSAFFLGSPSQFVSGSEGNIEISSSNFHLQPDGDVVMAGTITAIGGTIGGLTIGDTKLSSGTAYEISSSTNVNDPVSFISSSGFKVSAGGQVTASALQLSGGDVGGLAVSSGQVAVGEVLKFKDSGQITGSNVLFTGGKIAAFDITDNVLSNNPNFFISGSATGNELFISASNFNIKASGDITGSSVLLDGGTIGGFTIDTDEIKSANVIIDSTNEKIVLGSSNPILFQGGGTDNFIAMGDKDTFSDEGSSGAGILIGMDGTNPQAEFVKDATNYFIFDDGIDIKTDTLKASGSNIILEAPRFFLGGNSQFVSGSNGNIEISSSNFHLTNTGDVIVAGTINATAGDIGGFGISATTVSSSNNNLILKSSGQITGSSVLFNGGTVGGFTIGASTISTTGASIGDSSQDLFLSSSAFKVDHQGNVTASNIDLSGNVTAVSGEIGGYTIDNHSLTTTGVEINDSTQQIFISSSAFKVDHTGNVTASNVDLSGKITATSGEIGGYTIDEHSITTSGVEINDSTQNIFISSSAFKVDHAGNVTASNVDLSGKLTATSGEIGGYTIDDHSISTTGVEINDSTQQIFISSSAFKVDHFGNVTASNVDLSGKITATSGEIGGYTIDDHSISTTGVEINDSSQNIFISSSAFKVDHTGNVTASNVDLSGKITAQTGEIGGFTIGTDLANSAGGSDALRLKGATGQITASNAQITGKITATSGQIAGFTVSGDTLTATNFTLDAANRTISIGTGNNIFVADGDVGIHLGNSAFASAPFSVTKAGVLKAQSGTVGGFTLSSDDLTATNFTLSPSGKSITLGSGTDIFVVDGDVGLQLGHGTFASAPFSVTKAGVLKATSGTVGGWTLGSDTIVGSNLTLRSSGVIETNDFATGVKGFRLDSANNGSAEFENVKIRGTLSTAVFEKETVNAVGGQLYVANSTALTGSLAISASATTMSVVNVTGFTGSYNNDGEILVAKKISPTGFSTEYILVQSASRDEPSSNTNFAGKLFVVRGYRSGSAGDNSFLGDLSSVSQSYAPGQVFASTGRIGTGYIRLNANPSDTTTPYIDIVERTGSGVYDVDLKARLGDLSGLSTTRLHGTDPAAAGFGLYSQNVFLEGGIVANTGSIGGIEMESGKLYNGVGTHGNSNTGFYVDSGSKFSLGDKLVWDGSTLTVEGAINILGGGAVADQLAALNAETGSLQSSIDTGLASVSSSVSGAFNSTSASLASTITSVEANVSGAFTAVSESIAEKLITDSKGLLLDIPAAPSGEGLFLNYPYMGFYDNSEFTAFISASGGFQFKADNDNLISFGQTVVDGDGIESKSFILRSNNVFLSGSKVNILGERFFLGGSGQFVSGSNGNIEISSSNFHLDNQGNVDMSGKITSTEGSIGGFDIGSSQISSSSGGLILNADGGITGSKFRLTGGVITSDVTILGDLSANSIATPSSGDILASISSQGFARFISASIGGFDVTQTTISDVDDNLILKSSGQITASAAQISGEINITGGTAQSQLNAIGDATASLNSATASLQSNIDTGLASVSSSVSGAFSSVSESIVSTITEVSSSTALRIMTDATGSVLDIPASPAGDGLYLNYPYMGFYGKPTITDTTYVVTAPGGSGAGYYIDGVQRATVELQAGYTYRFDTSDGSMGSHPFRFSTDSGNSSAYTTGVTVGSGYVDIVVTSSTPSTLYYYCTAHGGMGGQINVVDNSEFKAFISASGGFLFKADDDNLISFGQSVNGGDGSSTKAFVLKSNNVFLSGSNVNILGERFFLGGQSQFVSGSNGNIEISSSKFHIQPDGDVIFKGDLTGASGTFGGTVTVGGTSLTTGNTLNANTTADNVGLGSVQNLNAQSQAQTGLISGTTITGGGITLNSGGNIKGGQTDFNTGTGFFLGYANSNYQFSIGHDDGNRLTWDGSNLIVSSSTFVLGGSSQFISGSNGNIEISSSNFHLDRDGNVDMSGKITSTEGSIGGFSITTTAISSSNDDLILKANGQITASAVSMSGTISATSGLIGGMSIESNSIKSTADAGDGTTTTYTVTVNGSQKYVIDGVAQDSLTFIPGNTYRFDQADDSNENHPLRFVQTSGGTDYYTTGVTTNGSPGSGGSYTQIAVTQATPTQLYYRCTSHSGMGGSITVDKTSPLILDGNTGQISGSRVLFDGGKIGGAIVTSGSISSGTSGYENDGFFLDSGGRFSLGDKLSWDGSNLSLEGAITITGGALANAISSSAQIADEISGSSNEFSSSAASSIAGTIVDSGSMAAAVQLTSTGMNILDGSNNALAQFGATVTVGQDANDKSRMLLDADSLDLIVDSGGTDTTFASFGATTTVGNTSADHVSIDSDSIDIKDASTTHASFGATTTIGSTSGEHIKITSDAFEIKTSSTNTVLSASSAGLEMQGTVKASGGEIGGFTLDGHSLTTTGVEINDSTQQIFISSSAFKVDHSGNITASNVDLSGKLTATSGEIGGYTIDGHSISTTGVEINDSTQQIFISSSAFKVDHFGNVTASNVDLSGKITATSGEIGGYTIDDHSISTTGVEINDSTQNIFISSSAFKVDHTGNVTASNVDLSGKITATSGEIGGFTIDADEIKSTNILIDSSNEKITVGSANAVTIQGGGTDNFITMGKTTFGEASTVGAILGMDADKPTLELFKDANNNFTFNDSGIEIKADTFDLATSTMLLDSGTNNGKIALGATPPTSLTTNKGFYADGTGKVLIGDADGNRISFDNTNLIMSASNFFLGSSGQFLSGSNGNIEISSSAFHLTKDGNVTMSGSITANDGVVGGFTIGADSIKSTEAFVLSANSQNRRIGIFGDTGATDFGDVGIQLEENNTSPRFYVGDGGSNFIKFENNSLNIKTAGTAVLSGSAVRIETPKFFMGGQSQFISGSNSNIEISSSNFHLKPDGDVIVSGEITADSGRIGGSTGWKIGTQLIQGVSGATENIRIDSGTGNMQIGGDTAYAITFGDTNDEDVSLDSVTTLPIILATRDNRSRSVFRVGDANQFIKFDTGATPKLFISSSNYFLGGSSQFISGSNGNIEISSSNFHLDASGDVSMAGKVTADSGQIATFSITSGSIESSANAKRGLKLEPGNSIRGYGNTAHKTETSQGLFSFGVATVSPPAGTQSGLQFKPTNELLTNDNQTTHTP